MARRSETSGTGRRAKDADRKLRVSDLRSLGRAEQNGRKRVGRYGQNLAGRLDVEDIAAARDLDAAILEYTAVLVGEDGNQHLVAEALLLWLPVDIEKGGVAAGHPILEHVPPIAVFVSKRHVVRHNVEHLPEPVLAQAL